VKFGLGLGIVDLLHIGIQSSDAVPVGSAFLGDCVPDVDQILAVALDVACEAEQLVGFCILYFHQFNIS